MALDLKTRKEVLPKNAVAASESDLNEPIDLTTPKVLPKRRSSFFFSENNSSDCKIIKKKEYIEKLQKERDTWLEILQEGTNSKKQ